MNGYPCAANQPPISATTDIDSRLLTLSGSFVNTTVIHIHAGIYNGFYIVTPFVE